MRDLGGRRRAKVGVVVAAGVQAEGRPPRPARRLRRAGRRPALPEPPPPRALHAGEHPGHDDHPPSNSKRHHKRDSCDASDDNKTPPATSLPTNYVC